MIFQRTILILTVCTALWSGGFLLGCTPQPAHRQSQNAPPKAPDFAQVFTIVSNSCMPCHNSATLPVMIQRLKALPDQEIGGDTRLRVLGELEELKGFMDHDLPISFVSETELKHFFKASPGALYLMLERSQMPPSWAPELMQVLHWPHYKPLTWEDRITLLRYARPHSQKYLR